MCQNKIVGFGLDSSTYQLRKNNPQTFSAVVDSSAEYWLKV